MFNWLHKANGGRTSDADSAVVYVNDKDPEVTAEPIFDEEPALYIVYPHALNPGSQAPKFTKVSGKFLVTFKKPCNVLSIVAKVIPSYRFFWHKIREQGSLPPLSCQILDAPRDLVPGEYELPFAFDFPCTSWQRAYTVCPEGVDDDAPYFSQYYTFEIHITRLAQSSEPSTSRDAHRTQTLIAAFPTRQELKDLQSDHEAWRVRYNGRFFALIASPVDPGELPPPLERAIEEFAPQLGPINLLLTSRSLTISALVNFNVTLPAFPVACQLQEIRGLIEGKGVWQTLQENGHNFPGLPYFLPTFTLKPEDFVIERDASTTSSSVRLSASISYRLPDDRNIGPTTLKGVKSALKSQHTLIFEFHVLDEEGKRKKITIREPVTIASCFLIPEYLHLPKYGSAPVPKSELQPQRPSDRFTCVCGFSFEQLIARENEGIMDMADYEPPDIKGPEHRVGMDERQSAAP